jgi:hypothetical protein
MKREVFDVLQQRTEVSSSDLPLLAAVTAAYAVYRRYISSKVRAPLGEVARVKDPFKRAHYSFDLLHYSISGFIGLSALVQ